MYFLNLRYNIVKQKEFQMNDSINFIHPIQNVLNNRYKTDAKIVGVNTSEINKQVEKSTEETPTIKENEKIEIKIEADLLAERDVRFDYDFEKKVQFVVTKDNKGNILTAMPFSQYISLINQLK